MPKKKYPQASFLRFSKNLLENKGQSISKTKIQLNGMVKGLRGIAGGLKTRSMTAASSIINNQKR